MESRSRWLACLLVLIATHLGGRAVTLKAEEISFKISSVLVLNARMSADRR